jgi:transposase-like protein
MTMTTKQYWSGHVAAVKSQAITTKAYAQRHGLVLSTLYYWQRKLKPTAATRQPGKFVSLHVKAPHDAARAVASNCTLVLGAGVRLEMSALPDPQWLTALARCAHGVR